MISIGAANHNSNDVFQSTEGYSDFQIPEYDSNAELLSQLVMPFVFLTIVLNFGFLKTLTFIMDSDETQPVGMRYVDDTPDVSRYALVMSLTVTAMLVPTPFWDQIRLLIGSFGFIALSALLLVLLYLIARIFR